MKNFDYFKIAFVFVATGLTVGLLVYDILTNIFFEDNLSIANIAVKSLIVGIGTGLLLGILNVYLKILPIKKRTNQ